MLGTSLVTRDASCSWPGVGAPLICVSKTRVLQPCTSVPAPQPGLPSGRNAGPEPPHGGDHAPLGQKSLAAPPRHCVPLRLLPIYNQTEKLGQEARGLQEPPHPSPCSCKFTPSPGGAAGGRGGRPPSGTGNLELRAPPPRPLPPHPPSPPSPPPAPRWEEASAGRALGGATSCSSETCSWQPVLDLPPLPINLREGPQPRGDLCNTDTPSCLRAFVLAVPSPPRPPKAGPSFLTLYWGKT